MKKFVSVLLVVSMLFSLFAVNVFAATASKTATFTFKASVLDASSGGQAKDKEKYLNTTDKIVHNSTSGKTITVYPGQVVWVTMHLKTGSKYYAGDLQSYIFYTTNIFKSTDQGSGCYIWDTDGKYSGICSRVGVPFSKMADSAIKETYPSEWSDSKRAAYGFYSVVMYPNPNMTLTVEADVDDDLVTVPIYVKSDAKPGETGSVFLPEEMIKSKADPNKKFMLSCYADKGNTLGSNIQYSDDYGFDLSKAKLNFVVGGDGPLKGDVNNDSKVNSSDALLVLQASTGQFSLSTSQKKAADINKDTRINSSDALLILQLSTGLIT